MICPGQDTRYWKPGDIFEVDCPRCGSKLEFFKDESARRCKACQTMVANPRMDFGCAAYCKYAEQCLGEMTPDLLAKRKDLLKDRVAVEMKKYFKQDFQSISHAMKVSRYAEQIASDEKADLAVVLSAAYLHAIACPEGETGAPAPGPFCGGLGTVQALLQPLGPGEEFIDEVLDTIKALWGNQGSPGSKNARILCDAHTIATEQEKEGGQLKIEQGLGALFHTEAGEKLGAKILLKESSHEA